MVFVLVSRGGSSWVHWREDSVCLVCQCGKGAFFWVGGMFQNPPTNMAIAIMQRVNLYKKCLKVLKSCFSSLCGQQLNLHGLMIRNSTTLWSLKLQLKHFTPPYMETLKHMAQLWNTLKSMSKWYTHYLEPGLGGGHNATFHLSLFCVGVIIA